MAMTVFLVFSAAANPADDALVEAAAICQAQMDDQFAEMPSSLRPVASTWRDVGARVLFG